MTAELDRLTPEFIEATARDAGISLEELCKRAGIALSTFYRWRSGDTEPGLGVYRRLLIAATDTNKVAA